MENTLMRRTQGFDYYIARRRAAFRLKLLLQHSLVIGLGGTQRIGGFEFRTQGAANKLSGRFEPTVQKNCPRNRFKDISQQRILLPAATLLLATSETQEITEPQCLRCFSERRSTHQPVLHAREFTFSACGV